ncbi:MAG: C39 family peptidase [Deltaproteobacteria bacterium]|nr:C39 family peptidase [Deltaproteobacteria bacterium]
MINGNNSSPQSGIGIDWQVTNQPTGAGASVTPTSSATDSAGLASSTMKLGSLPGDYIVNATCSQCTSGSPQTFTATAKCQDVPQYHQDDYSDPYDSICKDYTNLTSSGAPGVKACGPSDETWKIKAKGCMLTNMAMILARYGTSFDPGTLNNAMTSDIDGYTEDGDVKLQLPDVVTGTQIKYIEDSAYEGDFNRKITVPKSLMDDYFKKCMPVIVQVYNSLTKSMHWVVVTGKNGDDYTINDPGYRANTRLSQYGDIYKIRPYENQTGGCQ